MSNLLIGADPEVFVADIVTGEIQSSIGVFPGTKTKPHKTKYGLVHKDNVLAEFSVKPSQIRSEFFMSVKNMLAVVDRLLSKHGKTYVIKASHELNEEYTSHYLAKRFGCVPDFNVWELDAYERVFNSGQFGNLRTAGGHIHIGFPHKVTMETQIEVVKACEFYIGLPSVFMDKDTVRKSLYGASGSFRPKEYGIEYRVPSNFWLKSNDLINWIYRAASRAYNEKHVITYLSEADLKEIRDTINNNDEDKALKLCDKYGVAYV